MSEPVKKINPSPESYSPKNKPEILAVAENLTTLPESAKIAFAGSINQNGPAFGPHTLAFASAATSLVVLMGAPHDTSVMEAHNTTWRNDNNYYRNLMISGEGFQFWNDVWNYFTDELPPLSEDHYKGGSWEANYSGAKDATPILDCFEITGIKVDVYTNYPVKSIKGGWSNPQALVNLTLCNLADGFPVLLLSGEPGDHIVLATGYENNGETLLAWTFTAGDRLKTNIKFSPAKYKRLKDWTKGVLAAVLIKSPHMPPNDTKPLLCKALSRGAELLRADTNPDRFRETFCGKGRPHVYPEIWDLAERRCYLGDALERAASEFETDKLKPAIDASRQIHDELWKVHAIWKEKKTKAAKWQIADILSECRQLDFTIADTIAAFLAEDE